VRFLGEVRRQDLFTRFSIQAAAATRDLATYKELMPGNIDYDSKSKVYVRAELFRPLFDFSPARVLTWLTQGYGDNEPMRHRPLIPTEAATEISNPDLETLSVITRAIYRKSAIHITYRALTSGMTRARSCPSRWPTTAAAGTSGPTTAEPASSGTSFWPASPTPTSSMARSPTRSDQTRTYRARAGTCASSPPSRSATTLTVYYKTADGKLLERMLFRTDEANLSLAEAGRPWAFDAPARTSSSPPRPTGSTWPTCSIR
jgi:hypothetical protein